jgi:hypothetical protein
MVCVMLVCCAGDKGEEQLAAWTLFFWGEQWFACCGGETDRKCGGT